MLSLSSAHSGIAYLSVFGFWRWKLRSLIWSHSFFFIYQYKCLMSESLHNHALVESQPFWNFDFIFTPSKMLSNFFIYFLIGYELFLSVLFILQRFGDFPKDLSADYFYFGFIWVRKYTCYDWNPSNSWALFYSPQYCLFWQVFQEHLKRIAHSALGCKCQVGYIRW